MGQLRLPLALVAALVVLPAVVTPAWRFHRYPSVLDAATSLVLLGCGLLARGDRRRDTVGLLLICASMAWSLPALVPIGLDSVDQVLARLGLWHITLLVLALLAATGWPYDVSSKSSRRWRDVTAILAVALGLAGVVGGYQILLPVTGVLVVAVAWKSPRLVWIAGILVGGELTGVAFLRAVWGTDEATILLVHELTVIVAAALLAADASRLSAEESADGDEDPLLRLVGSLGQVMLVPHFDLAFPTASGAYVDLAGRPAEAPVEGATRVRSASDEEVDGLLAIVSPEPRRLPSQAREALLLLRDQARLRHALSTSLDELKASQRRLLTAGDMERRALGDQLRGGALARVDRIAAALTVESRMSEICELAVAAQTGLEEVVSGLDPLERGLTLAEALEDLARVNGLTVELDVRVEPQQHSIRRTAWFVCAEAVSNALKYAPGSTVSITVKTAAGVVVTVTDDGPGGADPSGSGLMGLADRAGALGGTIRVVSPADLGTRVTLELPGAAAAPASRVPRRLEPAAVGRSW